MLENVTAAFQEFKTAIRLISDFTRDKIRAYKLWTAARQFFKALQLDESNAWVCEEAAYGNSS